MRYFELQSKGFMIGSGIVEAACKPLVFSGDLNQPHAPHGRRAQSGNNREQNVVV
jgi:hypothetical protein